MAKLLRRREAKEAKKAVPAERREEEDADEDGEVQMSKYIEEEVRWAPSAICRLAR